MRNLKPDTKDEKLHFENTNFLASHFYDKKIHFPVFWDTKSYPGVYVLKKSIEILKSGDYSKPIFIDRVLNRPKEIAPEFWKDPYFLQWYDERKAAIENLIQTEQIEFENNPYKDDVLLKKDHNEEIEGTQGQLNELNEIIELSNEFRKLINEAFPGIENRFTQLLQKHEEKTAFDNERRKLRQQKPSPDEPKEQQKPSPDEPKDPYKYTLEDEPESKVLENYNFWKSFEGKQGNKNIFKGITQHEFLNMISTADFSEIKKRGISQRVEYNTIVILSHLLKDDEWKKHAENNLQTTYDNALKRSNFNEYEQLKNKFLQ